MRRAPPPSSTRRPPAASTRMPRTSAPSSVTMRTGSRETRRRDRPRAAARSPNRTVAVRPGRCRSRGLPPASHPAVACPISDPQPECGRPGRARHGRGERDGTSDRRGVRRGRARRSPRPTATSAHLPGDANWPLDVTDRGAIERVVAEVVAALGPVDILVNNAGVSLPVADRRRRTTKRRGASTLAVNLVGVRPHDPRVPAVPRARRRGRIVNIASTEGLGATPYISPYTVSKHGVVGLTRSLACELGPQGVTVNCICPGPINTGMTAPIPDDAKRSSPAAGFRCAATASPRRSRRWCSPSRCPRRRSSTAPSSRSTAASPRSSADRPALHPLVLSRYCNSRCAASSTSLCRHSAARYWHAIKPAPVHAMEVAVHERVPRLGLVARTFGESEVPLRVLLPRVGLEVGVLLVGAGLHFTPVAVEHVLTGCDELRAVRDGPLVHCVGSHAPSLPIASVRGRRPAAPRRGRG